VSIQAVASHRDRHVIHAYFNTCPESPDGKYVVYFTSPTVDGESGDIRILERSTGKEVVVAADISAEDAHRAACQQWANCGKTVVYHNHRDGRWYVMAVDVATLKARVLAENRQVGFGSPTSPWIPIYGCHWKPGKYRDLDLAHVLTGEIRTAVKVDDVVKEYGDWIAGRFGTTDISIFFPIMSPDGKRVFFKLSRPSGSDDFRSKSASRRDGKVVYDLDQGRLLRLIEFWGHPSWSPDSQRIFEKGNFSVDVITGKSRRYAPSSITNHPVLAPDGSIFVTDANVTKRKYGNPGDWAIAVGSTTKDDFVVLHVFGNTQGAKSWRPNHPHPVFSADGQRVYYNVNAGTWTTLMVAERAGVE
jgi:Tol biopolymer transport system component